MTKLRTAALALSWLVPMVLFCVLAFAGVVGCNSRPVDAPAQATPPPVVEGSQPSSQSGAAGAAGSAASSDAGSRSAPPGAVTPAVAANALPEPELPAIDMLFWEHQSWKPGGGSERLTLWADGRSEIWVTRPGLALRTATSATPRPRPGWKFERAQYPRFVRTDALPKAEARQRFARAVAAGIERLETFQPEYVDGAGTLVGIRRGGALRETVVPMFLGVPKGSENERRYQRVAEVIGTFDTEAYE